MSEVHGTSVSFSTDGESGRKSGIPLWRPNSSRATRRSPSAKVWGRRSLPGFPVTLPTTSGPTAPPPTATGGGGRRRHVGPVDSVRAGDTPCVRRGLFEEPNSRFPVLFYFLFTFIKGFLYCVCDVETHWLHLYRHEVLLNYTRHPAIYDKRFEECLVEITFYKLSTRSYISLVWVLLPVEFQNGFIGPCRVDTGRKSLCVVGTTPENPGQRVLRVTRRPIRPTRLGTMWETHLHSPKIGSQE